MPPIKRTSAAKSDSAPRLSTINNISEALLPLAVDVDSLVLDPLNARIHPERNMESLRDSLAFYGQVKPIVVRQEGLVVVAGNGTLIAARELGWTKIAANVIPLTELEAAEYGLTDNRTSELARWDYDTVGKVQALIRELGGNAVGWDMDQMEAIRINYESSIPRVDPCSARNGKAPAATITLKLTEDQSATVDEVVSRIKSDKSRRKWSDEDCVAFALRDWIEKAS